MVFKKGKTLILSAEHCSVVQKQASRGIIRGKRANEKLIKKRDKSTKIHPKNDENQYKFHARKSDAKKHRKTQKLVPKRVPEMEKKL
jgi:hypothetical protein